MTTTLHANSTSTKSWRDVLKVHPAAELFPRMSDQELDELGANIEAHGIRVPIATWVPPSEKAEYLLDAQNRLDAAERHGLLVISDDGKLCLRTRYGLRDVPKKVVTGVDPYEYVISVNILRRHLTPDQKRDLIAKLVKGDPGKSDRKIAEAIKASPTTVGKVRKQLEDTGDVSKVDTRTDAHGRQQPAHKPKRASKPRTSNPDPDKPDDTQASADARKPDYAEEEAPAQRIEREQLDNVAKHADFMPPVELTPEPEAEPCPGGEPAKTAMVALSWLVLAVGRDPQLADHLATIASIQNPEPLPVSAIERVITLLTDVVSRLCAKPAPDTDPLDVPGFLRRSPS